MNKAYTVAYRMYGSAEVKYISLLARSKEDAWDKAYYEEIPKVEGEIPYSAWVYSVIYGNGNYKYFNTFEGNPY